MDNHMKDTLGGGLFLLFGLAVLFIIPFQMPEEDPLFALGPATFPRICSWSMIALGTLLGAKGYVGLKKERGSRPVVPAVYGRKGIWAVAIFVIMMLYGIAFMHVPYLVSTPVTACLILAMFRVRKWYFYLTVVLFSVFMYLLFARFMLVPLP